LAIMFSERNLFSWK